MTPTHSKYAIRTENVTKIFKIKKASNILRNILSPNYDNIIAVDNLNLQIKNGEIFGLLGPNGAGKTTTIQIICGLLFPTKGTVWVDGVNVHKNSSILRKIGVMFSDKMLYNRLTGYNNLKFFAKLYGIKDYETKIQEIMELLELSDWLNKYVEYYSLGMRTKLAIARTLLHDPEIILLDEPTLGLDIINANFIRKLLKNLNITILITTHYINETESLCDRIGFLFKGKLLKIGTPHNLKQITSKKTKIHVKTIHPLENFIENLKNKKHIREIQVISDKEIIIDIAKTDLVPFLIKELSNYEIENIVQKLPSLEDIFIQLLHENKNNFVK